MYENPQNVMVGTKNVYKDIKAGIFSLQGGLAHYRQVPPPSHILPPINSTRDMVPLINPVEDMVPYKKVI